MNGVKDEDDLCFCMLLLDWLYRGSIGHNVVRGSTVTDELKNRCRGATVKQAGSPHAACKHGVK